MPVQQHDVRRPSSEGSGFVQRFWSPSNAPVFNRSGKLIFILHTVEEVTEFIALRAQRSDQTALTAELLERTDRMEAQGYVRAQEISRANG